VPGLTEEVTIGISWQGGFGGGASDWGEFQPLAVVQRGGIRNTAPQEPGSRQQRQPGPTFEALFEKVKQECLARKKAKANAARTEYRNKFGNRIMKSMAVGTVTGAIRRGAAGAAGGAWFAGLGVVPGAIYGGVVGGIFGAAGGVFAGVAKEPLHRAWYNYSTYNPALNGAHLDCDAKARGAVFDARNGGRR